MNSTSSGSGLRSVLAIASAPRSATSRRRISASISPLNCSMRCSYSSRSRRSSSDVSSPPTCSRVASISLSSMPVEVEVAQRAVQVVRAADRAARLHAGEALHGLAGHRPHHRLVAVEQRLHQQVGDLLGRQRVHAPAGRAAPVALAICSCISRHISSSSSLALADAVLGSAQAEVDLEHGLERPPVGVVLDQRGAEGVLERLPVVDRDVLHRLHRVEVLGQADRQPGVAQLDDEPVEQLEHAPSRCGRRSAWRRRRSGGHHWIPEIDPPLTVTVTCPRRSAPWPPWRCRSGT